MSDEFKPNHDGWIDKNIMSLAAAAYGFFKLYGRCSLVLRMPSNLGLSVDTPINEVQIDVRMGWRRNKFQRLVAKLLRLENHVERVIQDYDPEREIAFEVWYPNGRGSAWCHAVTPSPAEAFAYCDDRMRERGSTALALLPSGAALIGLNR